MIQVPIWFYIIMCLGYMGGTIISLVFLGRYTDKWYLTLIDYIMAIITLPLLFLIIFVPKKVIDKIIKKEGDK